jgi:hypothetical protein
MENNLLSKTFKIIHNSPKNLNNLSVEDPINKINQSLNNLLISLQNDNTPICKELNLDNENEEEISNYYMKILIIFKIKNIQLIIIKEIIILKITKLIILKIY